MILGKVDDRLLVLFPGVKAVSDSSSLKRMKKGSWLIERYLKMRAEDIIIDDLGNEGRNVDTSV